MFNTAEPDPGSPGTPPSHPRTQEEALLCVASDLGRRHLLASQCLYGMGPVAVGEPEGKCSTSSNFSLKFSMRGGRQNPGLKVSWRSVASPPADWTRTSGASSLGVTHGAGKKPSLTLFPFNPGKVQFRCEGRGKGFPGGASGKNPPAYAGNVQETRVRSLGWVKIP